MLVTLFFIFFFFFFSSRRRHTRCLSDWSSDVCSSDLERHGNFLDEAYQAIFERAEWRKRFNKIHAQGRSIPKLPTEPIRKWRELDSSMSSDALLMNVFCTSGVVA